MRITEKKTPGDKFRELIIFIAAKSAGDRRFGATKLNKLLFYIDFLAYLRLGNSISEQRYQKLENGPAPRGLVPARTKMLASGEIALQKENYYGRDQHRIVALREPDLSLFTGPEVGLMEVVVQDFLGKNASEISQESHEFIGWELAKIGEDIPYEVALVAIPESSKKIIQRGSELAAMARSFLEREEE